MNIVKTVAKAGKTYSANSNGAQGVKATYQVVLTAPLAMDELPTSFSGVPAIGSEHPSRPGLYVTGYEITQPDGEAKHTLNVEVSYAPSNFETQSDPQTGTESTQITEWGWDDGTTDVELLNDAITGDPVVNSAGDPFEEVPTHSIFTPTFTKVFKTSKRKDWNNLSCVVNSANVTIGDLTFAPHTLLATVGEKILIGETVYPYEYTIHIRLRSQKVKIAQAQTPTEIGWDLAIVDAGMREMKAGGVMQFIEVWSKETGQPTQVTTSELLNGHGEAMPRSASGTPAEPYVLRFAAYPEAAFPDWMVSEPTITTPNNSNSGGGNNG